MGVWVLGMLLASAPPLAADDGPYAEVRALLADGRLRAATHAYDRRPSDEWGHQKAREADEEWRRARSEAGAWTEGQPDGPPAEALARVREAEARPNTRGRTQGPSQGTLDMAIQRLELLRTLERLLRGHLR